MEHKSIWEKYSAAELKKVEAFAQDYMKFLSASKTERECVDNMVNLIEKEGYIELNRAVAEGRKLKAGDKVYLAYMNKTLAMFNIGKQPLSAGMNILGAHIDSPRMDVKQNPLYEDEDIALLDTHYYGGIKKYQWVNIPLALHGVIIKKDGTTVEVNLGEEEDDPVFYIADLLVHLAVDQLEKKGAKVVEGEALDVIVGNKPLLIKPSNKKDAKESKNPVKDNVLSILKDMYDIEEEDFLSAELEVVPAGKARDVGFDRSMILGYGHDDRVCAYPSVMAMLEVSKVDRTSCCLLVDKEETGSNGATSMHSRFFENALAEIMQLMGEYSELELKRCLSNSTMLSSDVSSAYDPMFAACFDKKNVAFMGRGLVFNKYTGVRGKYNANDANPEYFAAIRRILDEDGVSFQTGEFGKVDLGGGGTIAYIMAQYGMRVIDAGVAVIGMHAPWECISKADLYETKRGYASFLKKMTN